MTKELQEIKIYVSEIKGQFKSISVKFLFLIFHGAKMTFWLIHGCVYSLLRSTLCSVCTLSQLFLHVRHWVLNSIPTKGKVWDVYGYSKVNETGFHAFPFVTLCLVLSWNDIQTVLKWRNWILTTDVLVSMSSCLFQRTRGFQKCL